MRKPTCVFIIILMPVIGTICLVSGCVQEDAERAVFPVLSGPYLGQTPPGNEPVLFAPGVVNTGLCTRDVAMMPDGSEIYFGVNVGNYKVTAILVSRRVGGRWTRPEVTAFSNDPRWSDIEPAIAPDGKAMFFVSTRPVDGGEEPESHYSIWAMEREGQMWGEPYRLPEIINDGSDNFYPSVAENGTLYFTRELPDGVSAIFRSRRVDGNYSEPERLPKEVNAARRQFNAFIAPDESYLIVPMYGMPDSLGATDYYIVFRNPDDSWSEPVNLGEKVNTSGGLEYAPYVSPDGKYFFFMSARTSSAELTGYKLTPEKLRELHNTPGTGLPGIYWMDASFLAGLRQ